MVKRKTPLLFLLIIFSAFSLYLIAQKLHFPEKDSDNLSVTPQEPKSAIYIGTTLVYVEVADTPEKRKAGLSGQKPLKENEGMLFDYKVKNTYPIFWMKGMRIPLDIIWINDGQVVQIDANLPTPLPETSDSDIPKYPSRVPVDYILEVNAGFSQKNQIKVGDPVDLSNID